ncbi:DUF5723 family protein [Haliscomenobacter hydrossis]|uniref:SH3 domain-containing protein n=1 Tax=Haliscomenobacter hydrossis (strain ATCC 27775 / DSM 1100 / LMG 10767 / O) TaxID=760192 RepID=F4KVJ6_HALH1|nr:DUF5723 family protein [Haliscomenobacter hydrossis]AEE51309.1 SH3 domain-containing protein [Haliscomenobacter hydrossis DSM 1100]
MKATPNLRIRSLLFFFQRFWLAFSLILLAIPIFGQRNLTLSQLTFAPQSYLINPGRMPLSKYNIGLPLMSGANGAVSSSGFKLGDFQEGETSEMAPVNPYKKFLDGLDQQNYALMDVSVNLLDLGFRIGKRNYINFFANENMNALMKYPRPLAEMLFNVGNNFIVERAYDIQTYQFNVLQYRAVGFGYTRQITNKISAGFRVKSLMGISHIQTYNDSMRFVSDKDDRYFGVLGNLSFMSSGTENLSPYYAMMGNLNFSNLAVQALQRNPSSYLKNTGNNGFAFDLGIQYNVSKELDLYASLLNMGSITWKKDITINPIADDNIEFPTAGLDDFNHEVLEFRDSMGRKASIDTTFDTKLPALLYLGGSYFINPTTSIDVVLNPKFYLGEVDFGFGVGITTRVNKILQVGGNISSFNKSTINFGVGTALNLGPAQLYLASDNIIPIFAFKSARTAHFNVGLTFNFGRQTREDRIAELTDKKKDDKKEKEANKTYLTSNKPKENDKKPNTPIHTTTARAVDLPPSVSVVGTVFNGVSKEQLTGVALEVFIQNDDGTEALLSKRTFGNGIILLSLKRDHNHRLILRKAGFSPTEAIISTDEMGGLVQLKKEFELSTGAASAPVILAPPVMVEEISLPEQVRIPEQTTAPATTESTPVVLIEKPTLAPTVSKISSKPGRVIVYRVLESSTIRQNPEESSLDLLPVVIGHRLELLEKTNDDWWKVRFRDFIGYLPARILELEE